VVIEGDRLATVFRDWLPDSAASAFVLPDLSAGALRELARGEELDGLVVASRRSASVRPQAEEALQQAGRDRFAVETIPLALLCGGLAGEDASRRARLILAGLVARVREHGIARAENLRLRLVLREKTGRRALLTLPALQQEVLPRIDAAACYSSRGCQSCVAACPAQAITIAAGAVHLDKERCRNCGICLPICPSGAVQQPFYGRSAVEAALAATLADAGERRRIVAFACPDSIARLADLYGGACGAMADVLPIAVPSAGFVGGELLLRAFAHGAEGAVILGCEQGARHGCAAHLAGAACAAAAAVLAALGLGPERVAAVTEESMVGLAAAIERFSGQVLALPPQPLAAQAPLCVASTATAAGLLAELRARVRPNERLALDTTGLAAGQILLDGDLCSLCGLCAFNCPSGSLRYEEDGGEARLSFDALLCAGCELCLGACPEAAITLSRRLEPEACNGPQTIRVTGMALCERCGRAFAPRALVERASRQIRTPGVRSALAYCPECRLVAALPVGAAASASAADPHLLAQAD